MRLPGAIVRIDVEREPLLFDDSTSPSPTHHRSGECRCYRAGPREWHFDMDDYVWRGKNSLDIWVADLLANRLIGDA